MEFNANSYGSQNQISLDQENRVNPISNDESLENNIHFINILSIFEENLKEYMNGYFNKNFPNNLNPYYANDSSLSVSEISRNIINQDLGF